MTNRRLRTSLTLLGAAALLAACATAPSSSSHSAAAGPAAAASAAPSIAAAASDAGLTPLALAAAAPASAASGALPDDGPAQARLEDSLDPDAKVDVSAPATDLWVRVRAGFAMPTLDNDNVRKAELWYSARPDYVQRMTARGSLYLYHIVQEVEKRHMPTELALLPFVESAFNPQANSVAKAGGLWQFMPVTGKDYALRQNIFRDDRRDVLASTRAALDYLGRLNKMFDGDWQLALAAYNWGPGNVLKAVDRNRRAGLPVTFESLHLPDETSYYLPKLQAVKNIVLDPGHYGLALPAVENHPYFLSVDIERDIDVALAAQLAGMSEDSFRQFNPQMNKPVILANGTDQVLLPYDNASTFAANLAEHHGPLASWTAWVVPRTMRPTDAAQKVGMSEAQLREVNLIPPRMLIKKGSTLLVPRAAHQTEDVSDYLADHASLDLAPDAPAKRRTTVKARKGDTLASVAKRWRVSADELAEWNKLGARTAALKSGQALVVYTAPAAAPRRSGAAVAKAGASTAPSAAKTNTAKAGKPVKTAARNGAPVKARSSAPAAPQRPTQQALAKTPERR
ncbi:MAG: transglycosylase SLT domain-containing protein [Pelomonas sp.]|nr:transglycosylase SLT domain-containing protein [Roseateles sp.]